MAGRTETEEIQKGDIVLSYDDNVGRYEETSVTDVFVNETDELTEITVGDETIVCTPGHMFLTADGWKSACDLSEGDVLKALGRDEKVVGVRRRKLESTAIVYNLSVIGCHTYVVGKAMLIVHNDCYYRGGDSFKASVKDVRRTKEGLVKTTRGVSLNTDKSQLSRFSKISQVDSIPDSLRIVQCGKNPTHYEIIPKFSMTFEKFNEELSKIIFHIVK